MDWRPTRSRLERARRARQLHGWRGLRIWPTLSTRQGAATRTRYAYPHSMTENIRDNSASGLGLLARMRHRLWLDLFAAPPEQFAGLNGLRGISAYLVVFMHVAIFSGQFLLLPGTKPDLSPFFLAINGFWVGLDVFFVLSGFLIGRILLASLQRTGTVEFWSFFTRRSMRIFPAYYLTLTFGLFVYARLGIHSFHFIQGGATWRDLLSSSWQNYLYVLNYYVSSGTPSIMSQAWSLCVEEHFYLALPPLLFVCFFARQRARLPLLLSFTSIFFVVRVIGYVQQPDLVLLEGFYYRSHNRFDEPMVGVLIAYFHVFHHDAFRRWIERLGQRTWLIGMALIASVWAFGGLQVQGPFAVILQFLLMALGAGFLIVNTLFLKNGFTRFFEHPFWFPVSRVSYSIFLNHMFVLYVVMELPGFAPTRDMSVLRLSALAVVVMALSILCASITYVLIERPLIDFGRRVSRRFRKDSLPSWQYARDLPHSPDVHR